MNKQVSQKKETKIQKKGVKCNNGHIFKDKHEYGK